MTLWLIHTGRSGIWLTWWHPREATLEISTMPIKLYEHMCMGRPRTPSPKQRKMLKTKTIHLLWKIFFLVEITIIYSAIVIWCLVISDRPVFPLPMDELMFVPSANNVMFMQIKPAISQLLISTMIFLRVSVIIVCTVVIDRCMLLVSLVAN
jgi:hypothetical protein